MRCSLLHGALIVAFCLHPTAAHAEEKTLQLKQTIPLPGAEGRIDHLDLDAANERLFVCALGNNPFHHWPRRASRNRLSP